MSNLFQKIYTELNYAYLLFLKIRKIGNHISYPVEIMLDLLSAGMSIEEILEDYPDLDKSERPAVAVPKQKIFWHAVNSEKNRVVDKCCSTASAVRFLIFGI